MKQIALSLSLAGLAFLMTAIWGGPLLRILRYDKIGKIIRIEQPASHRIKMGTPTMGGVMFIFPVLLLSGLLNAVALIGVNAGTSGVGRSILVPMAAMVGFAILGAADDWEGIRGKRKGDGMRARTKFAFQLILALVIAYILKYQMDVPDMYVPGLFFNIELGWWYVPIAAFIIVAESNAINFTDGLDGLAGLIAATAFAAFGGIAIVQEQVYVARFCFILVGALFGFLWFNVHPAELIMGDTGSLSLGAVLAIVSLMTGQWLMLLVIGIIPLSEMLSVVIQISYFRMTKGKRFFKMTPIHHHFELLGWSETQVVQRFWLIGLMAALIGIGLSQV